MLRNLLTLLGGGGLAQLINLLATPIVTKLYRPDQFGLFTLFVAVATLFMAPSTGRYEQAAILPREDEEAYDVVRLAAVWCVLFSLGIGVLAFFLGEPLCRRFGHPELAVLLPFLSPFLLGVGFFVILTFWFNRLEQYRLLASSKIVQVLATAFFWVVFGLVGWTGVGLVLGAVLGWLASAFWLQWGLVRLPAQRRRARLGEVARKFLSFPLYAMPAGLLKSFSDNVVFFALGALFAASDVGQFGLAFRALSAPMLVAGMGFGQILNRELARQSDRPRYYLRQLGMAVGFMTLLVLPVALFGPPVFGFVFGSEWSKAGELARWLCLWMVASYAVEAVAYAFTASHLNWLLLVWRAAYLGGLYLFFQSVAGRPIEEVTRLYGVFGVAAYFMLALLGWWACTRIARDDAAPSGA